MPDVEERGSQKEPEDMEKTSPAAPTTSQAVPTTSRAVPTTSVPPQEKNSDLSAPHSPNQPPTKPPRLFSVTDLMETAKEVSKMSIAHEIVVNQNFHLEKVTLPPNSLESWMKETMYRAFWDNLKEQLSAIPPDYTHVLKLLQEIKEILLSLLLPHHARLRSQIEEAMDMELLRQEAEHGALDVPRLSAYIRGMMAMLCAPVRDEEVQKLQSITDPVQLLREIFQVLGLMKMDMLNFTIRSLRPHLKEHSVQYERTKFQELLDRMPNALDYTVKWLSRAAAEASLPQPTAIPDLPDPASTSAPGATTSCGSATPSSLTVLNQGYMNLLHWEPGNPEYPETLLMDRLRIQEIQSRVHDLTILGAVLLVTGCLCGPALVSSPPFIERLKRGISILLDGLHWRLEEALLSISHLVSQEVSQALVEMGLPALSSDQVASLKGQIQGLAKAENSVRNVIEKRIHLFLSCCLSCGVQMSLKDLPGGLPPIQGELAEVGHRFLHVINHNRQVFGPYYAGILKKLLLTPAAQRDPTLPAGF
ncbi:T-complex protein 11 homolog isoform X1 [Ornithorhynchus anatinus]|nr:T-complex protein 11 homolog isoform X1 [Ornithorhynchus anatinus]XP_039768690.1 T-complex protein 11 homolog isoform X1 [Ornithorhynchus anatinus]